jgi:hypothetical protein
MPPEERDRAYLWDMLDAAQAARRQMLREDEEDLAAARSRPREKTLGYEEFLAVLKATGRR